MQTIAEGLLQKCKVVIGQHRELGGVGGGVRAVDQRLVS